MPLKSFPPPDYIKGGGGTEKKGNMREFQRKKVETCHTNSSYLSV